VTDGADASDADLARRAQAGDKRAFDQLARRHKGALYRFIRRYVGHGDDAYDILQESFISAWLALPRYDGQRAFLTWLRAIALNKCRDQGRRLAVRRRILRLFALERPQDPEAAPDARSEAEKREAYRLMRLDEAIAQLPAFYKEPLLLTTVMGLSQQDTASQLNTTAKAIEMRIRRAKKKLAEAVSDLSGEG
jgi:RNA polymerase sigma factor CnrH